MNGTDLIAIIRFVEPQNGIGSRGSKVSGDVLDTARAPLHEVELADSTEILVSGARCNIPVLKRK